MKDYTPIRPASWEEVFTLMKAHEAGDPHWEKYAREVKGFDSWESWRRYQASMLKLEPREWEIFRLDKPLETVPYFKMGPGQGWQNHYTDPTDKNTHTFADLIRDHTAWVRANKGVQVRLANWPADTFFIGLLMEDNSVVLFEGNHRASALSLSIYDQCPLHLPKPPTIALTRFKNSEKYLLDAMLTKGSVNPDWIR